MRLKMDSCQSAAESLSKPSSVTRAETSPLLGHRETSTLPPNSHPCEDVTSTSSRPHLSSFISEPPSRFPQQSSLTFPFSPGVTYLSPPLSDPDTESPPYQPGTNDIASLDMHSAEKQRKNQRRLNKRRVPDSADAGTTTSHLEYIKKAQTEQPFKPRQSKSEGESRGSNSNSSILPSTPIDVEHPSNDSWTRHFGKDEGLPNAEKLTKVLLSKRERYQSLIGTNAMPVPSLTTAFAVRAPDEKALNGSSSEITLETPLRESKPRRRSRAYREGNRRRKSVQVQKYDTPAIITLRKASSIMEVRKRRPTKRDTWRISTSKQQSIVNQGTEETPQGLLTDSERPTPETPSHTVQSNISSWTPDSNSPPVSNFPIGINRPSTTVDLALVSAEVHPTPDSYSSIKNGRKHSVLAIDTMRRMSKVQTLSKSESLEIIWNRDDSPSSISSNSLADLFPSSHVSEPEISSESESTGSLPPRSRHGSKTLYWNSSSPLLPALAGIDSMSSASSQVPPDLLRWSWDKQHANKQIIEVGNSSAGTKEILDESASTPSRNVSCSE